MVKTTKILTAAMALAVFGVAALPAASYAVTDTSSVTVQVQVTDGVSLSCTGNYAHNYGAATNATDSTGAASEATPGTCTVISNVSAGYDLTVAMTGATNNLVSGGNNIAANASHAAGTPGWAIDWDSNPATGGAADNLSGTRKVVPVSGSGTNISSPSTVSAVSGDIYKYGFSSSIASTTLAGTYNGTVVFTVVTK